MGKGAAAVAAAARSAAVVARLSVPRRTGSRVALYLPFLPLGRWLYVPSCLPTRIPGLPRRLSCILRAALRRSLSVRRTGDRACIPVFRMLRVPVGGPTRLCPRIGLGLARVFAIGMRPCRCCGIFFEQMPCRATPG
eukprot:scaffold24835_cov30-Tisochrysis_lutea.AAC.2